MFTTLHIGPSELYPVIPGCVLSSTAPRDFWKVVIPSVVRHKEIYCHLPPTDEP